MYELSILKSFLRKENYYGYRGLLDESLFTKDLLPLLAAVDEVYEQGADPSIENISNILFSKQNPTDYLRSVLEQLRNLGGDETLPSLLSSIKSQRLLEQITVAASDLVDGRKPKHDLFSLVEALKQPQETRTEYVSTNLASLLESAVKRPGLRWRLKSLNRACGSLRKGDLVAIFARPETGKTTFLASEATFMASQLGDSDGPVLWFNNEEQGTKVQLRAYQAALNATLIRLLQDTEKAQDAYQKTTRNKIRIVDDATITKRKAETIIRESSPSLIIFDQLDKVLGFAADRYDLQMGDIYQWAREVAKGYAPVIGTSQADGTAEGVQWPTMGHMANSKTSKAAEADLVIGIGRTLSPGFELHRYLSICKNKLVGDEDTDPTYRHAQITTLIRPQTARYEDL